MKIYIKILLTIVFFNSIQINSQMSINLTSGSKNYNPALDKFIGVWKWENSSDELVFDLRKKNIPLPPYENNIFADGIYGYHKFSKNNQVIENSMNFSGENFNNGKFTLLAGLEYRLNPNELKGHINHISKNNKRVLFEIEYIDATHIKLVSLSNSRGTKVNISGQPAYDWSINLPQNIILTKQ